MIRPDILLDAFTDAQIHVKVTIVTFSMDLVYKGVRIPTHLLRIALVKYQLISSKVFISIKNYFMFPNNIKRDSFHQQKKNLINAPRQYSSCVIYNCIYLLQSFLYFGSYWLDNISNDFLVCADGQYIFNRECVNCSSYCKDISSCNKLTGKCENGCIYHRTGDFCQGIFFHWRNDKMLKKYLKRK